MQTHDSTKIDILTIIPFVSNILTFFARNLTYDKPNDIHVNVLHKYVCAWVLSIIIRNKYNSISTWTHLLTTLTIRLKECDPSPSKDIAAILFWYYIFESLNDVIQKQTELFVDSSLLQILIHSCAPSYQAHIQSVVLKLVEHSKCEYTFDILLKCNITPDMLSTVVLDRRIKNMLHSITEEDDNEDMDEKLKSLCHYLDHFFKEEEKSLHLQSQLEMVLKYMCEIITYLGELYKRKWLDSTIRKY